MKSLRSLSAPTLLIAGTALVLVVSLAWHFLGGRVSSGDGKLVAQATKLESQGDAAGAEAAYKAILASDPANLAARSALARLADARAAEQEARLEQSASLPPEPPDAIAQKMAAAQAQMDAMLGQFSARSGGAPVPAQSAGPPEPPDAVASKMAAAQAQIGAMLGQFTARSGGIPAPPAGKEEAPSLKTEPASLAMSAAPGMAPTHSQPAAVPATSVPQFQPAIPPPGVPLALATPALPPAMPPAMAPPPSPPPAADSRTLYEYIDGINPGTGTFTLTSGGRWIERCPDANIFEFAERARQAEFIELYDASRQIGIRLAAKGTLVQQSGAANGAWQELYPGGWRTKTTPGSPKVIVRMVPEDVSLANIKGPGMNVKPAERESAAARPADTKPAVDPNAQDLSLLQGAWECVSAHKNGFQVRDYDGVQAVIKGTRLTWAYPRKGGGHDLDEASFAIDATKSPRRFDWYSHARSPAQKHLRIYAVDASTLRIGSSTSAGGVHPASFEQCVWVFLYRRIAADARH